MTKTLRKLRIFNATNAILLVLNSQPVRWFVVGHMAIDLHARQTPREVNLAVLPSGPSASTVPDIAAILCGLENPKFKFLPYKDGMRFYDLTENIPPGKQNWCRVMIYIIPAYQPSNIVVVNDLPCVSISVLILDCAREVLARYDAAVATSRSPVEYLLTRREAGDLSRLLEMSLRDGGLHTQSADDARELKILLQRLLGLLSHFGESLKWKQKNSLLTLLPKVLRVDVPNIEPHRDATIMAGCVYPINFENSGTLGGDPIKSGPPAEGKTIEDNETHTSDEKPSSEKEDETVAVASNIPHSSLASDCRDPMTPNDSAWAVPIIQVFCDIAEKAITVMDNLEIPCAITGGLACFLLGMKRNSKHPNRIDILAFTKSLFGLWTIQACCQLADLEHRQLESQIDGNTLQLRYRVNEEQNAGVILPENTFDVIIRAAGRVDDPHIPVDRIVRINGLPLVPFPLLLVSEIHSWDRSRTADGVNAPSTRLHARYLRRLLLKSCESVLDQDLIRDALQDSTIAIVDEFCNVYPHEKGIHNLFITVGLRSRVD